MFSNIINFYRFCRLLVILIMSGIPLMVFRLKYSSLHDQAKVGLLHKLGKRVNITLQKLGPSFIKLGQILSTRSDLIGEEVTSALAMLQDKVPSFSYRQVKQIIEKNFGKDINQIFKSFNKEPIAAASIAQVHKAVTFDDNIIAVKILRPGIETKFTQDIKLFDFITRLITNLFPYFKRFRLDQVVETLKQTVMMEVDLRIEGASADQLRENCKNDDSLYIPKIYWQYTSKDILAQEWIDGIPVSNKIKLLSCGYQLDVIAKNLAITFFNQAYRDGFFHADIHPGNIMIGKRGKIILVDFGITGYLEKEDRIFVARIIYGFITRDYKSIADIHFENGYVPSYKSRELFALTCRSIGEPIVGMPVNKIYIGKLLKQLFEISKDFDMYVQPKFLLLQKTIVTVEGTGFMLNPEVNMWQLAEPWIKEWADKNFGFKAKCKNSIDSTVKFFHNLPITIDRLSLILERLEENIKSSGIQVRAKISTTEQKSKLKITIKYCMLLIISISICWLIFKI